jgi:type I restriction enzyme S subunit
MPTSLSLIENLETELASSKADLSQLDQSILAKAFRGELVLQDPNDEPASVLHERIRSKRTEEQSNGKTHAGEPRMKQGT